MRLRAFRESLGLSLRAAAVQLHVSHPALKSWEEGDTPPEPPFRRAVEVWTSGAIKESDWSPAAREREYEAKALLVRPAVSANDTGEHPTAEAPPATGTDQ